ncbi:MAG: hypothetical protein ACJ73S_11935 [Mycobacteriales bacterium]
MIIMAERVDYYAITSFGKPAEAADGLARRRVVEENGKVVGVHDEAIRRDLSWAADSVIVEWEHGESTEKLVPVSEGEAARIVERFRTAWGPPPGV